MVNHHKLGGVHYNGKILADAYKSDMSGDTVTLYEEQRDTAYVVVEWDKSGDFETYRTYYDDYDNAVTKYVSLAFNR